MCVLSGITYSANIHSYYNLVKPFFFFISVSDPQPGILQKYQGKKRDEGWGGFWEMWIIGASMLWRWRWITCFWMNSQHSFQFDMGILRKTLFFFSRSTYTTLMNNAFDAAENTFILTVCLRILGNRIFHSKKENGLLNMINEPTSMLCNTDIWINANDETALTMISLTDEMSIASPPRPSSICRCISKLCL